VIRKHVRHLAVAALTASALAVPVVAVPGTASATTGTTVSSQTASARAGKTTGARRAAAKRKLTRFTWRLQKRSKLTFEQQAALGVVAARAEDITSELARSTNYDRHMYVLPAGTGVPQKFTLVRRRAEDGTFDLVKQTGEVANGLSDEQVVRELKLDESQSGQFRFTSNRRALRKELKPKYGLEAPLEIVQHLFQLEFLGNYDRIKIGWEDYGTMMWTARRKGNSVEFTNTRLNRNGYKNQWRKFRDWRSKTPQSRQHVNQWAVPNYKNDKDWEVPLAQVAATRPPGTPEDYQQVRFKAKGKGISGYTKKHVGQWSAPAQLAPVIVQMA